MAIETGMDGELAHTTYADMLDRLHGYDDPAVHVQTIDGYLDDPSLVSDQGKPISFVNLSYTDSPDSTIVITAGRHSPEYGGAEAAMELVDRVLASPEMQAYLQHGEVTIVPVVHVDEYSKPADERMPGFKMVGYHIPSPDSYKRYDACHNSGHEGHFIDPKPPSYEGEFTHYDQIFDAEADKGGWGGPPYREHTAIPKETYAVARLLEEKKEQGKVLFAADLHETDADGFEYCTLVFDEELKGTADAMDARVKEGYPTQGTQVKSGLNTFSGLCNAYGIDAYTTEGSPRDEWRQRPLAERVEQQLLALDALFDHYC
ncbi:MAG: hypothetical protein QF415_07585 [Candidatus Undinarchaeales archaeon]|nr:hypothetical protein [Candidatus Undinarchaeales archaeon]MDP7492326.1 hypothetical protein [Candidatus Undinarchaeales archaeon]